MSTTKLQNLINPEVMGQMIGGKIESLMTVAPFAKVDTSLQGQSGDTITVPYYGYIGDAIVVAEGDPIPVTNMTTSTKKFTIQKIANAVGFTDESLLSGYGNPLGEGTSQLAKSIASKVDVDVIDALQKATVKKVLTGAISYNGIVEAIDLFDEEVESDKVMFISPKQKTQLRLDPDFTSKDKYPGEVVMNGEIGRIAGVRIVVSKRVIATNGKYLCPIIRLTPQKLTQDESPAVTVFLKRETQVEKERVAGVSTKVVVTKHYGVAITNESLVVVAEFSATRAAAVQSTQNETRSVEPLDLAEVDLSELEYNQLQELAKANEIAANQTKEKLIEELEKLQ